MSFQKKRKRASSLPSSVDVPRGEGEVYGKLVDEQEVNPSELCYCCGTNWKKRGLKRYKIDSSLDLPRVGKYPVFIEDPKVPESDSLCTRCYGGVQDFYNGIVRGSGASDGVSSGERAFIGENSAHTWCPRVIVSISLLISLVAFFVGALKEAGVSIDYALTVEEGVALLTLNLNNKLYEWTSSTFRISSGNHHRQYSIHLFISNAIYLTGNRITPLFRYLDLLGIWHQPSPRCTAEMSANFAQPSQNTSRT